MSTFVHINQILAYQPNSQIIKLSLNYNENPITKTWGPSQ